MAFNFKHGNMEKWFQGLQLETNSVVASLTPFAGSCREEWKECSPFHSQKCGKF